MSEQIRAFSFCNTSRKLELSFSSDMTSLPVNLTSSDIRINPLHSSTILHIPDPSQFCRVRRKSSFSDHGPMGSSSQVNAERQEQHRHVKKHFRNIMVQQWLVMSLLVYDSRVFLQGHTLTAQILLTCHFSLDDLTVFTCTSSLDICRLSLHIPAP
jgi:hypothetical protein